MYKLYYSPGACSLAIHVVLEELGVKFEAINVNGSDGNRSAEFLKINPRGQVPVFFDGKNKMFEGAAILIHVAEQNNSNLLPKSGEARANALQWLMFCNATLHPAYSRSFFLMRNVDVKADNREKLCGATVDLINKLWNEIENRLNESEYLAGNQMTLADILMTVISNWSGKMPGPIKFGPKTTALLKKISSLPSYQKAMKKEGVEYKAV